MISPWKNPHLLCPSSSLLSRHRAFFSSQICNCASTSVSFQFLACAPHPLSLPSPNMRFSHPHSLPSPNVRLSTEPPNTLPPYSVSFQFLECTPHSPSLPSPNMCFFHTPSLPNLNVCLCAAPPNTTTTKPPPPLSSTVAHIPLSFLIELSSPFPPPT